MGKYLDLTVYRDETFDLKIDENLTINIRKPSKRIMIDLMAIQNTDFKNADESMKAITDAISIILNNNTNDKKFVKSWIDENLNYYEMVAIFKAYSEFSNEIINQPF